MYHILAAQVAPHYLAATFDWGLPGVQTAVKTLATAILSIFVALAFGLPLTVEGFRWAASGGHHRLEFTHGQVRMALVATGAIIAINWGVQIAQAIGGAFVNLLQITGVTA